MKMSETQAEEQLREDFESLEWVDSVYTFDEAGLLTRNKGLVIKTEDGSAFQITIVKSR